MRIALQRHYNYTNMMTFQKNGHATLDNIEQLEGSSLYAGRTKRIKIAIVLLLIAEQC